MAIHHNTVKRATSLGVVLTQDDATGITTAHWTEKNKRGYSIAGQVPALVDDMRAWQMVAREYPNLKVDQPYAKDGNYIWEVELHGKVIGEAERLHDAWLDALDTITAKTDKPAPKSKAKSNGKALVEDMDDDAEDEADVETVTDEELDAAAEDDEGEGDGAKSVVKRKYKQKYRPFKMTCGDEISQLLTAHVTVTTEDGKRIDKAKLVKFAKANGCWVDTYKHLNVGMIRMNVANRLRSILRNNPDFEISWN